MTRVYLVDRRPLLVYGLEHIGVARPGGVAVNAAGADGERDEKAEGKKGVTSYFYS